MGFKDIRLFNVALLGRQIWCLVNNKDTLCFTVLSAKYFPSGDPFVSRQANKPSSVWSSFVEAAKALGCGFGWQVGNGKSIELRKHNWGFEGLGGNYFVEDATFDHLHVVRDLWNGSTSGWNRVCVERLYGLELGGKICNIPLISNGPNGRIVWFHSPNGVYTTKSGYSWLILRKMGYGPHRIFWGLIWKLKVTPKVRVFAWRAMTCFLPT